MLDLLALTLSFSVTVAQVGQYATNSNITPSYAALVLSKVEIPEQGVEALNSCVAEKQLSKVVHCIKDYKLSDQRNRAIPLADEIVKTLSADLCSKKGQDYFLKMHTVLSQDPLLHHLYPISLDYVSQLMSVVKEPEVCDNL
ncbi:MAG: hypothetical protein SVR94_17235 [Pseudomonadota bacterium]|nr:hypothetical protein [Pseudomonadota bacterium]